MCLFTLPGIPSVYYGGEWGVEGKRTRTSDDDLRPAISMDQADTLHALLPTSSESWAISTRKTRNFTPGAIRSCF